MQAPASASRLSVYNRLPVGARTTRHDTVAYRFLNGQRRVRNDHEVASLTRNKRGQLDWVFDAALLSLDNRKTYKPLGVLLWEPSSGAAAIQFVAFLGGNSEDPIYIFFAKKETLDKMKLQEEGLWHFMTRMRERIRAEMPKQPYSSHGPDLPSGVSLTLRQRLAQFRSSFSRQPKS